MLKPGTAFTVEHVELDEVIRFLLVQHGCTVNKKTVTFPEGTQCKELLPRLPFTHRDILTFPDNTIVYKLTNRIPELPVTALCVPQDIYEDAHRDLVKDGLKPSQGYFGG